VSATRPTARIVNAIETKTSVHAPSGARRRTFSRGPRNGPPASLAAGRSACRPWFPRTSRRTSAGSHPGRVPRGSVRHRPVSTSASAARGSDSSTRSGPPVIRRDPTIRQPRSGGRSATFASTSSVCVAQPVLQALRARSRGQSARSQVASTDRGSSPGFVNLATTRGGGANADLDDRGVRPFGPSDTAIINVRPSRRRPVRGR
jgi:hypothetical protein